MSASGEQFIHQLNPELHTSPEVEHAREQKKQRGEPTSDKPVEKLSDWFTVIEKTHLRHSRDVSGEQAPKHTKTKKVLEGIKTHYHAEYVITPEDVPESYYLNQQRLARERGYGNIELSPRAREQMAESLISDQRKSLDVWVDYFTSPDSDSFPMWAKYWSFTGMTKLSTYDKEVQ